jgi:SAM-dependent methyltransferase
VSEQPRRPGTRWPQGGGADYARRFADLAASGRDLHGEARFCTALVEPGARILDAGCGTGRIAIELVRRGYSCVGLDVDASMLAEAERAAPDIRWVRADLADPTVTLTAGDPFDLVLCAGNVVPLVASGSEATAVATMARQLRSGGLLVTGFGLDRAHLPPSAARIDLDAFDGWCRAAGLVAVERLATWDGDPWPGDGGYAVSVFRRS